MATERITYRDPDTGRRHQEWAQIVAELPGAILYTPLNNSGEDRSHYNQEGTLVEVQRLLSIDLIISRKPARQSPKYGTMEVI